MSLQLIMMLVLVNTVAADTPQITTNTLLETLLNPSISSYDRRNAVQEFEKRPCEARILEAFSTVLTDSRSDSELIQAVEFTIHELMYGGNRDAERMCAPEALIHGLRSTPEIRRRSVAVLRCFSVFPIDGMQELLTELQNDDEVFIALSHRFVNVDRLCKLATQHPDWEIRTQALNSLWHVTRDPSLCLPLALRESAQPMPTAMKVRIDIGEACMRALALIEVVGSDFSAEWQFDDLKWEIRRLGAFNEQCKFNLGKIAIGARLYDILQAHPVTSGMILFRMATSVDEPVPVRIMAAKRLAALAREDNAIRQQLLAEGVVKSIPAGLLDTTNPEITCFLYEMRDAMITPHDRFRSSLPGMLPPDQSGGSDSRSWSLQIMPYLEQDSNVWFSEGMYSGDLNHSSSLLFNHELMPSQTPTYQGVWESPTTEWTLPEDRLDKANPSSTIP